LHTAASRKPAASQAVRSAASPLDQANRPMRRAQLDGANHLSASRPVGFAHIDPLQPVDSKPPGKHFV